MLYPLIRKLLFSMPPEVAHEFVLEGLRAGNLFGAPRALGSTAKCPCRFMGLDFTNPVGLAAGMDKNGEYVDALGALGFGFIEVGTVTPRPQPGNPKPRVFRLPRHEAMINRLGFNNRGVDHLVERVSQRRWTGVLGINIGKNFDTPMEHAADDYLLCLEKVYAHADYVTVNISSPNTQGLRGLQEVDALGALLGALAEKRARLADEHGHCVPLVVKLAPDLDDAAIPRVAAVIAEHRLDGVIATNTTISRDGVAGAQHAEEAGGLSGAPLRVRADQVLEQLREALPPQIALIGTGGITRGVHAARKIDLGAGLVQFYTGFVYRGPDLIGECVQAIRRSRAAAHRAA